MKSNHRDASTVTLVNVAVFTGSTLRINYKDQHWEYGTEKSCRMQMHNICSFTLVAVISNNRSSLTRVFVLQLQLRMRCKESKRK